LPILEKKSEKKFLTLIIPTVPLYSNQFESHIPMIHNNNFIFNPCFKIIDHLNDNIKNNDLIIRFIPRNFGLNEYEVFEKKYPKIKKDLQKISYENILSNTKIFLSPYLGTGFLETLSMNIPTIIINSKYNENIINNHVKEVFEDLKKVKIFFDNEIDLTNHINSIWENPRNWWENKNLQNARISFCERFAFKNDNKLNDLINIIIE
jgi:putative transferase (TIGR04331 family)